MKQQRKTRRYDEQDKSESDENRWCATEMCEHVSTAFRENGYWGKLKREFAGVAGSWASHESQTGRTILRIKVLGQ